MDHLTGHVSFPKFIPKFISVKNTVYDSVTFKAHTITGISYKNGIGYKIEKAKSGVGYISIQSDSFCISFSEVKMMPIKKISDGNTWS
jgi:hypothetical protein